MAHPDMYGNKKQTIDPAILPVNPYGIFNEKETAISINEKMIEASKNIEINPVEPQKSDPVIQTKAEPAKVDQPTKKQDLPGMEKVKAAAAQENNQVPIGIPISSQQWDVISAEAAKTANPEETVNKYVAAITYAREYGMEVPAAMQSLEQLNQYQLGRPYQPTRTNTQSIANSFKVSSLTKNKMDLAIAFRRADLAGEDVSQLSQQIQELDQQILSLQDDAPRNWFIEWLKLFGGNSVYSLEIAGHGLAVGGATALALGAIAAASGLTFATQGLAAPVASSVIPVAMGTIVAAGTAAGTAQRSFEMEQGLLYQELRSQGIPKDIANYMSSTSGMITGVTEALFNQIGSAAMRQMGKVGFVNTATSKVLGRLAANGKLGAAAKGLLNYTLDAAGEFPQEWVQSVSNSFASDAAYALSDMVPPEKSMPVFQQAFAEGLQGFAVGLLMGGGTAAVSTALDVMDASQLNKQAQTIPSKEAFIDSTEAKRPEAVSKEDWNASMDAVWTKQWADREQSTAIQSEEAAVNELDAGKGQAPSGRIRRLSNGDLFTQESDTVAKDTQGIEHHQMLVGDPITSQRYGFIEYALQDNALTIEDVKIRSGYESIRKESVLSLLKQYPGYEVTWEAKGENLEALKQEIIDTNPRGKDAGLQVYDGVTNVDERLKLEKIIGDSFPNLNTSERSVASTLLQLRAEAKGMTVDNYIQSVSKDGKLYAAGTAAQLGNEKAKGAVAFDADAKAIIYAAEKADFSTFVHETFHVIRREMEQTEQLKKAMMEAATTPQFEKFIEERRSIFQGSMFDGKSAKEIAEYAKSFDETWTRQQEELAAKLWESYLTEGKAVNKKLSGIFRRIAEWMGKIYRDIKNKTKLDPRIEGVFDSLLDKNSPLAKSVRASEKNGQGAKTLFQESENDSQYDEIKTKYKGTDQWMKAPNGKPTNLSERQWLQVRTPSFLKWFGDWINDSENASKILDENGEPKVVRFSLMNQLDTDDNVSYGYLFAIEENKKTLQGKRMHSVFLDSRNLLSMKDFSLLEDVVRHSYRKHYDPVKLGNYLKGKYSEFSELGDLSLLDTITDQDDAIERMLDAAENSGNYFNIIEVIDSFRDGINIDSMGYYRANSNDVLRSAAELGYDGVALKEDPISYVVFSPDQIRSAKDNTGEFYLEDGKPKIDTGYPKIPEIDYVNTDLEKIADIMDEWKEKLREWVSKQGDMLQFGYDELVYVVHKNVIPDEKPWRATTFTLYKGQWLPTGHSVYDTKFDAVLDNAGDVDYRPDILFQETTDKIREGSLAVLHNITAEKLSEVEKIGGLPSPSLAITKPNIPFDQFGEITLIADPSVATKAMNEERLYDRDVWSPTVPRAEWKVNQKVIDKFDVRIGKISEEVGRHLSTSESFSKSDIANGLNSLVHEYKRNLAAQLTFLKEKGIEYALKYKEPRTQSGFPISIIKENKEYFDTHSLDSNTYEEIKSYLTPLIEEYLEDKYPSPQRKAYRKNIIAYSIEKWQSFRGIDEAFRFAKDNNSITQEFDDYATQESIKSDIDKYDQEFTTWLEEGLREAYTNPKITIGSKKHDYTAENILKWMKAQSEKASQETMTYGPAKAAANAGQPFMNRRQVKEAEESLVTTEEHQRLWEERIQPLNEILQSKLPEYHKYGGWEALDSIYAAIGRYLARYGSSRNPSAMRKELSAKSFTNVPNYLLNIALDLAGAFVTIPQDYFEAKPNRVVSLDEFVMAVVPSTIKADQRAILEDHGIEVVEYVNDADRPSLVDQLYKDHVPSLLFQEFAGVSESQIMDDAKTFDSWEEFYDFYTAMLDPEDTTTPQDEQWYREVWEEANKINTKVTPESEPQTVQAKLETETQKDEYFRSKMMTDKGVNDFIEKLGWIYTNQDYEHSGPESQEEADFVTLMYEMRANLPKELHPTVNANAIRRSTGKQLTQRAIKSIRTLVTGEAIRHYRDVYADVMEDPELKAKVIDERLPKINEPGYEEMENMSIMDRVRLSQDIEGAELKKKILSGKETMEGDAEKVIRVMDRKIADLQKQIAEAEAEIEAGKSKLTETEQWRIYYATQLAEAQKQLDSELKAIRKLTDENRQVPEDQMKNAVRLRSKVELLHDQVMKNRASERVKATLKRQEALDALKDTLRERQKERDDARKVREYKLKLSRQIMVKPGEGVDLEYKKRIMQLQATLDPEFRQASVSIEGERVTIEEAKQILEGTNDEEIRETLGDRLYQRIKEQRKPLNDWTIAELEEVAEKISYLRLIGRRVLDAKNEQKRIIAENYRNAILGTLLATGKYVPRPLTGSAEDLQQKKSAKNRYRAMLYSTWPYRVKALMLDNHQAGSATNLLVTQYRELKNQEFEAIEKRQKKVFDAMKEAGIDQNDLYEMVPITLDGKSSRVTKSYLAYAWLSQFSKDNREAVAYGSLVSIQEKNDLYQDNDMIRDVGNRKYKQLLQQAKYYLFDLDESGKMEAVIEAIRDDLNSNAQRVNEVGIREYNQEMRTLDHYLPMHRLDLTGDDLATNIADDLYNMNAGGVATSVEGGFRINRINISPLHQSPVEMDLIRVWDTSLRQHEHFIAFAEYGRKLNRVFKNLGSQELRTVITQTYGKALIEDIDDHINEVMNPQAFNRARGADKMLRAMRGNLGAAYLAWKLSGLVLQAITSPMPFLADVSPVELIKGYLDMSIHPLETWEIVSSKSQMMKNRTPNPIIELILKQSQDYGDGKLRKFNTRQQEIGTMGLTLVDRWAVAGGWLAAYRQKLAQMEAPFDRAGAEKIAVDYADEVVLRTQPQGDSVELSPLFKMGGEAAKAITQFQTALNVIWTNITYDVPHMVKDSRNKTLPDSVRKAQFRRAVGQVTGYVLAGAILGAVQEGHDDDDEALQKLRDWIYWSFTQFTGSVPIIGNAMDEVANSIITGEKPMYYSTDIFPAVSNMLDGVVDISQGDFDKALKNLGEGFGYFTGAPVSGMKQIVKMTKQGPGALLGR